jgi:ribosomal protein S18 acetylase RimI-like enzyme
MKRDKASIQYESIGRKDLGTVEPLWKKLNQVHRRRSKHFKDKYRHFRFEERIAGLLNKVSGDLLLVLTARDTSGKKIIGYCISSVDYLGGGEIDSIFVEEKYRGKGVGEELMKRSLVWLGKQKPKNIKLSVAIGNEEVFGFYEKFGFLPGRTVLEKKGF